MAQTLDDFEVVVVEGGSNDEGPFLVQKMMTKDNRIRLIEQDGKGVSNARNQGIIESKSELIAFLDADDEWHPTHLKVLCTLAEKYPEAGAYTTAYLKCTRFKNIVEPRYYQIQPSPFEGLLPNYFESANLGESPVWTSAVCIPKKIFKEVGGFSVNSEWGEDTDMWGRIGLRYPIAFSWEGKAIYHIDTTNSLSSKKRIVRTHPFVETVQTKIREGEMSSIMLPYLKEYVSFLQLITASTNIKAGNQKEALKILFNCKTKLHRRRKMTYIIVALIPTPIRSFIHKLRKNYVFK